MEKVKRRLNGAQASYLPHVSKLTSVRPIVLDCSSLPTDCSSFDDALMLAAAAQVFGMPAANSSLTNALAAAGVDGFASFYKLLIKTNGAAVIVLDEFTQLINNTHTAKLFHNKSTPIAVFGELYRMTRRLLQIPGMVLIATGSSTPELTYQIMYEEFGDPPMCTVVLDALTVKDILIILHRTTARDLRAELGLRSNRDVQVLASCLHSYTGGLPGVVEQTIAALVKSSKLRRRGPKVAIEDVLTKELMERIYKTAIQPMDLLPTLSRAPPSWNKLMTFMITANASTVEPNNTILAAKWVSVGQRRVKMVDLLSVMGVPFTRGAADELKVNCSPWVVKSLTDSAVQEVDLFVNHQLAIVKAIGKDIVKGGGRLLARGLKAAASWLERRFDA